MFDWIKKVLQTLPHTPSGPADPNAPPAPAPAPVPVTVGPAWLAYLKYALWIAGVVIAVGTFVMQWQVNGKIPDKLPDIPPLPQQVASSVTNAHGPTGQGRTFGWVNDSEARRAAFAARPPIIFSDTPAGKTAMGDLTDTYLWRAVRKAAGKGETADWYPNIDQGPVGCCVGAGNKHGADVCQGVQVTRDGGEFKTLSAEVIYGLSRVDIGGGRMRGDGSVGAWAAQAMEKVGVAAMQKYAGDDLTTFSPLRARAYGSRGVPADIKAAAKEHPVKATALVRTWADVQRAVSQGYPVPVCSDVGFEDANGSPGTRDSQGFVRARGTWPHCMCLIGVRGGDRPGAFCLNSWGDDAHHGPRVPADAPAAGFWVDAATVERMVSQGDSFSLSDMTTFPSRKLDWVVNARPLQPRRVADPLGVFALAP
jgi:hypothetical protein